MKLLAEVVLDTGHVDAEAWRVAHRDRLPVAKCSCGGPAMTHPLEPESTVIGGVRWYSIRCSVCGAVSELPATRKLRDVRRPSREGMALAAEAGRRRVGERL